MAWDIPKIKPKLTPSKPRFFVWLSVFFCLLVLMIGYMYLFVPINQINSLNALLYYVSFPIIIFTSLLSIRFIFYELHSYYVSFFNESINDMEIAWQQWTRRHISIIDSHRLTYFGKEDISLINQDPAPFNKGEVFSIPDYEDIPTWERHIKIVEDWITPLFKDETSLLKSKKITGYFVCAFDANEILDEDKKEEPSTDNLDTENSPSKFALNYTDLINTQLSERQLSTIIWQFIPPDQLSTLLESLIDSPEHDCYTLICFADPSTDTSEEYIWWLIGEPDPNTVPLSTIKLNILRPIATTPEQLKSTLGLISTQQQEANKFEALWLIGNIDESVMVELQTACNDLAFGFMPLNILHADSLYGTGGYVRIGTLLSLLSQQITAPALVLFAEANNLTFYTLIPAAAQSKPI